MSYNDIRADIVNDLEDIRHRLAADPQALERSLTDLDALRKELRELIDEEAKHDEKSVMRETVRETLSRADFVRRFYKGTTPLLQSMSWRGIFDRHDEGNRTQTLVEIDRPMGHAGNRSVLTLQKRIEEIILSDQAPQAGRSSDGGETDTSRTAGLQWLLRNNRMTLSVLPSFVTPTHWIVGSKAAFDRYPELRRMGAVTLIHEMQTSTAPLLIIRPLDVVVGFRRFFEVKEAEEGSYFSEDPDDERHGSYTTEFLLALRDPNAHALVDLPA